jgi:hypothetical protein
MRVKAAAARLQLGFLVSPPIEILRGFDSRRLHTSRKTQVSDRNDSDVSTRILVVGAQRRLKVAGIKVGVDVRGCADVGMAGEHLRKLQVPGTAWKVRDRGVAGLSCIGR